MERCRAQGILGHACQKVPGLGKASCLASQEVANDPSLTQAELEGSVEGCEFVESGEVVAKNKASPPAPTL